MTGGGWGPHPRVGPDYQHVSSFAEVRFRTSRVQLRLIVKQNPRRCVCTTKLCFVPTDGSSTLGRGVSLLLKVLHGPFYVCLDLAASHHVDRDCKDILPKD